MRRLCLMTTCILAAAAGNAQTGVGDKETSPNIVERICTESSGNIQITISNEMVDLIRNDLPASRQTGKSTRTGINKTQGWRIQVFSDGRNQHSLESRAKARGNAIVARFPKYRGQVYTFSKSPNWYTRVGNFKSSAEAEAALAELKRAFPSFASEMRAVRSQIVVIGK